MKLAARWTLRVIVAVALIWAGLTKIRLPYDFFRALRGYALLPDGPNFVLTYLIPGLELAAGAAILSGVARRAGWAWAATLGAGFVFYVGSAWYRHLDVACGCFGGSSPLGVNTLIRSLLFLALACTGLFIDRTKR